MVKLFIKKLDKNINLPEYKTEGSSGLDLIANIKKTILNLEKNIDILSYLSNHNYLRPKLVIGFAAETESVIENAKKKLSKKHCDWIIANDVSKPDFGFNKDQNEVTIIDKNGKTEKIRKSSKKFVASVIAKKIVETFLSNEKNLN